MRMRKLSQVFILAGILAVIGASTVSQAATINLYPDTPTSQYWGDNGRATFFQALDNVTLSKVGIVADPSNSLTVTFGLYNSDSSGNIGSLVSSATKVFTDSGFTTYDAAFSANLLKNAYYFLYIHRDIGTGDFGKNLEGNLPYSTPEGYFKVLDGGNWDGKVASVTWGNTYLPTFTVDAAPVPLPSALWLLGPGLVGMAGLKRRFIR
jgi:hypothetical protein